ncbi:hypothetical protein [Streptomyces gardneri]|uniref:hypothetical protein n=1 Tax=Streptomyces gardneri TaxID=66892 RepID=UPI0035D9C4E9
MRKTDAAHITDAFGGVASHPPGHVPLLHQCEALAGLVAMILATRQPFSDVPARTMRTRSMSLQDCGHPAPLLIRGRRIVAGTLDSPVRRPHSSIRPSRSPATGCSKGLPAPEALRCLIQHIRQPSCSRVCSSRPTPGR